MTTTITPLAEITHSAIHLLCREIGIVNTARFIGQFTTGYGDYTKEREALFDDLSVEGIAREIERHRNTRRQARTKMQRR